MFVELIEVLRCPRPHEDAALIASAQRTVDRHIVDGTLGCPVCHSEFRIRDGVAVFAGRATESVVEPPSAEMAMRIAAFLELVDSRGFAILYGRWGAHADQLRRMTDTPLAIVNPTVRVAGDVAATILTEERFPLASASAQGVALDDSTTPALADDAVRVVRSGGRVVGPVALAIPRGLDELVRDDRHWVAQKTAAPDSAPLLTALHRSKR